MLLTKKAILAALPIFESELFAHAPTRRHENRLSKVLASLKRKKLIVEHRHEKEFKDADGKVTHTEVTICYARNAASAAA